jgi:hypothetical protein
MRTSDKRNSPRIIVDLVSVEIDRHTGGDASSDFREICTVKNISETGMLFEADLLFTPGNIARLTFALPESPIVIRTNAIVVHAKKTKKFEIGVQFKDLAIAEQKLLRHFIIRHAAEPA